MFPHRGYHMSESNAKSLKNFKLPRIQRELAQCLQCGYCIEACEAYAQTPWESVTPRGKIYYLSQLDKRGMGMMDKLLNRKTEVSPTFVDAMYKCTGCGNCEAVCHAKIHLVHLWEDLRAWLVDNDVAPLAAHKKLASRIAKDGNPYGEVGGRDNWWPEDVERKETPDVIFFAGCTGSYRMQGIPAAGARVMDRAGVSQNCLGDDEICCTSPAIRTGVRTLTLDASKTVVTKADGMGAVDMVMTCSGCYKTVSTDFGNYYSKPGQNVYHFSQYVENLINERKLKLIRSFDKKVTYHDPCHLGRHAGVYEPARNVLKKIKGLEFVEMKKNRENSRCCGAGGGYKSAFNDFAVAVAKERIEDAEAVGAEVIATSCPFCVLNLRAGAKAAGSKIKVMDLSEILLEVTEPLPPEPAPEPKPVVEKKPEPIPEPVVEVKPEPVPEPIPEPIPEPVEVCDPIPEPMTSIKITVDALKAKEEEEEDWSVPDVGDDFTLMDWEETPEDLLRRAAWNKGLRCRRQYGPEKIPIAFVKPKVAVYVVLDTERKEIHDKLEKKGWKVLIYSEYDITDGELQAEEIKAAVKESLKEQKAKKRKKKK